MDKLVVIIMGQNCEKFIDMCLESVKDADAIVYCDGGSTDGTLLYLRKNNFEFETILREIEEDMFNREKCLDHKYKIIENKYDQEDREMNGKQRNFYLNYLKENYPNDWCLVLDADEVVEDLSKIKEFIQSSPEAIYSVKMRHFQQDLGHEDALVPEHFVPNRLFKISEADEYPLVEHPVLKEKYNHSTILENNKLKGDNYGLINYKRDNQEGFAYLGKTWCTVIWHLAYIPNLWEIKRRYDSHLKKSDMHTPEFLKKWYYAHLFGEYPKSSIILTDIPEVILNKFGVNKDELYFKDRNIDLKHPLMVQQWNNYFKPESVLDLGCGRGPYLYFWRWFIPNNAFGIELSTWAFENAFLDKNIYMANGDICDENMYERRDSEDNIINWDLITAIDVLEHLDNTQLDKAMKNIVKYGKRFLFSVPVIGDPNLTNDKTHKQFRSREDWIRLWESFGIKIIETPKEWLFGHQLFIGER